MGVDLNKLNSEVKPGKGVDLSKLHSELNYDSEKEQKYISPEYSPNEGKHNIDVSEYSPYMRAGVFDNPALEETRAQGQSNLERVTNAIPRLISKVGTEIAKTPAYLYAVGEAGLTDKNLAETLDNAWLNTLENLDSATKEKFAVYTPKSVKDGNLWDNLTSTSFWTTEGVDGAGFLIAMMAPGAALKSLGLAGKVARLGVSANFAKNVEIGTATLINTTVEAAAETKGLVDSVKPQLMQKVNRGEINEKTGKPWTEEDVTQILGEVGQSAFLSNMALIAGPNFLMNKNLLGRFTPTKNTLNNIVDEAGQFKKIDPLTKKQMLGEFSKELGKGLFSEGFVEEAGQFAIEDYHKKLALGETDDDLISGLLDSYGDALTTTEGQKSIFLGGLFGSVAAVGGVKQLNQEKKYESNLSKVLKENFEGFSTSLDNLYQRNNNGEIILDENNEPILNYKKASEAVVNIALENKSSKIKDVYALAGNKEAYDYIANNEFTRFALPYLQEEGGLELLDKHIDLLSKKMVEQKKAVEGVDDTMSEMQYVAQLKQKAKQLQKTYNSVDSLVDGFNLNVKPENQQKAGEFLNKLKNAAYQETAKQFYLSDRIDALTNEMNQLSLGTASSLPQVQADIQKISKQVENHKKALNESIENYKTIFDTKEQNAAFKEYLKEDSKVEEVINKTKEEVVKKEEAQQQAEQQVQVPEVIEPTFEDRLNELDLSEESDLLSLDSNLSQEELDAQTNAIKDKYEQERQALKLRKEQSEFSKLIDKATNPKELDSIVDQIDSKNLMSQELIDKIAIKRDSLKGSTVVSVEKENILDESEKANNTVAKINPLFDLQGREAQMWQKTNAGEDNDKKPAEQRYFNFLRKNEIKAGSRLQVITRKNNKELFDKLFDEDAKNYEEKTGQDTIYLVLTDSFNTPTYARQDGTILDSGSEQNLVYATLYTEIGIDNSGIKDKETAKKELSELREQLLATNKPVSLAITSKSNGVLIREKNEKGKRKFNPVKGYITNDIKSETLLELPTIVVDGFTELSNGQKATARKLYAKDSTTGEFIDLMARNLTNDEALLVTVLIAQKMGIVPKTVENPGNELDKLVHFGVPKEGPNEYTLGIKDNVLYVGEKAFTKDQLGSEEAQTYLENFLLNIKYVNANGELMRDPSAEFEEPILNKETGDVEFKKWNSYQEYLLSDEAGRTPLFGTDVPAIGKPRVRNYYVTFDQNIISEDIKITPSEVKEDNAPFESTEIKSNIDLKADIEKRRQEELKQPIKDKLQEIEKAVKTLNITTDKDGKLEQTSDEIITNIKSELDKIGLPYKGVASNENGSSYKVITNDGTEIEVVKLLKSGGALIKPTLSTAKFINHLIKTEPQTLRDLISNQINAKYDAEYVDAVKKGEITKEQAMQALEEIGRKDSSAYAELDALEGTVSDKKADIERRKQENDSIGKSILQKLGYKNENRLPNGNVKGGQAGWKIRFNIKNPKTGESYYDGKGTATLLNNDYDKRAEILINFLLNYFGSNEKADYKNLQKHYILEDKDGSKREPFKHLAGGEIGESDFTIYIGSADDVMKFISDIRTKHPEILELLHAGNKSEDIIIDDIFKGRIEGSSIGFSGYHVPTNLNKVTGSNNFTFNFNENRVNISYNGNSLSDITIIVESSNKGYKGVFDENLKKDFPELYKNIRNIIGFQLYGNYLQGSNNEFLKLTGVDKINAKYDAALEESTVSTQSNIEVKKVDIEKEYEKGDYAKVLQLVRDTINGKQITTPESLQLLTNYPKLFEEYIKIERRRQEDLETTKNIGEDKLKEGRENTKKIVESLKQRYPATSVQGIIIRILEKLIDFSKYSTIVDSEYINSRNASGQATWFGMMISQETLDGILAGKEHEVHTFIHEFIHGFTTSKISDYNIEKQGLIPGFKSKLTAKEKNAIEQLQRIFEKVKRDNPKSKEYGFTNLDEFIAEAFSNSSFQYTLKNTKAEGKKSNLFSEFINAIGDLLFEQLERWAKRFNKEIPDRNTITGILEDVLAWTEELIDENNKLAYIATNEEINAKYDAELAALESEKIQPEVKDGKKVFKKSGSNRKINLDRLKTVLRSQSTELTKEEKEWFKSQFPTIPVEDVKGLIDNKSFGRFVSSGKVLLSDLAPNNTLRHEAFHVVTQLYLTPKEIKDIYSETRKRMKNKDLSDLEVEEILAEDFANYKDTGSILGGRKLTESIFDKILNFIKKLVGLSNTEIRDIYNKLETGQFLGKQIVGNNQFRTLDRSLPGKTEDFTKNTLDGVDYEFFSILFENGFTPEKLFQVSSLSEKVYDIVRDSFIDKLEEARESGNKIAEENFEYILENWDKVLELHNARLKSLGISLTKGENEKTGDVEPGTELAEDANIVTEESVVEDENKDTRGGEAYKNANSISTKDLMFKQTKLFIRTLPKVDENGEPILNDIGLPSLVDFNSTYNFLLKELAGKSEFPAMVEKIKELSKKRPEFNILLERLGVSSDTLSFDQILFQNQFRQDFDKNQAISYKTILKADGTIYTIDATRENTAGKIKEIWKNKLPLSEGISLNGEGRLITTADYLKSENNIEFLSKIGITFSKETLPALEDNKAFSDAVLGIKKTIINSKYDLTDLFNEKSDAKGNINTLLDLEAKYTPDVTELSFISTEGKTVYSISLNNALSVIKNIINNAKTKEELFAKLPHLNSVNTKNSLWLKSMFDADGNKRKNVNINLDLLDGLATQDVEDKAQKQTTKLSKGDKLVQELNNLLLDGKTSYIRASDKSTEHALTLSNYGRGEKLAVPIGDLKDGVNSNKLKDIFRGYFKDELQTIFELAINNLGADIDIYRGIVEWNKDDTNVKIKWRLFSGFPDSDGFKNKVKAKIEELKSSDLTAAEKQSQIDDLYNELVPEIDNSVVKFFDKYTKELTTLYNEEGINETNKLGISKELAEKYSFQQMMRTLAVNDFINTTEQIKLFVGDMGFYKDLFKRTSGATGTKKTARVDSDMNSWLNINTKRKDGKQADGKINVLVFQDSKQKSDYFNSYVDSLLASGIDQEQAKSILSAYQSMDEADAQGYITLDEYREFFIRTGDWKAEHQRIFEKSQKGETLTGDEIFYFMPIKAQYFGPQDYKGLFAPAYHKYSLMPLIPKMIEGTNLEKLLENMTKKENQIGYALFKSGSKVGTKVDSNGEANRFYTNVNSGEINSENLLKQVVDYKFLGIQLDIAPKLKKEVIFGTQFRKLLFSNLFENSNELMPGAKDLFNEYSSIFKDLIATEKSKLIKELGINPETYKQEDVKKLVELLRESSRDRNLSDNVIDALQTEEVEGKIMLKYNFDLMVNKSKIDSMIMSLVNSRLIRQMMNGDAMIQGASTGFEKAGKRHKGSNELKFYREGTDGKTLPMEVKVPLTGEYRKLLDEYKTIDEVNKALKSGKIDKKTITLIGYRIPTQGLNSIEFMEIQEFLPESAGNLIILPTEIVAKSGGDYDIDKMNIFRPWLNPGKNDVKIKQNRIIDIAKEILEQEFNFNALITPNSTAILVDVVDQVRYIEYVNDKIRLNEKLKSEGKKEESIQSFDEYTKGKEERLKKINYTDQLKLTTKVDQFAKFLGGKAGVGIGALQNTHHILSQIANLHLNKYYVTDDLVKKPVRIFFKHNKTENGNVDLSKLKDVAGKNNISEVISQVINASVDIAKDPFMFDLNMNLDTLSTYLYLVRTGVEFEQIAYFMKQPIITEYLNELNKNKSVFLKATGKAKSSSEIVKEIEDKYLNLLQEKLNIKSKEDFDVYMSDIKDRYDITTSELKSYLSKSNQDSVAYLHAQIQLLQNYVEYKEQAGLLSEAINSVNHDTAGLGSNLDASRNKIQQKEKVEKTKFLLNNNNIYSNTFVGGFDQHQFTIDAYSQFYSTQKVEIVENNRNLLSNLTSKFTKEIDKNKVATLIENDFINYVVQNYGYKENVNSLINRLFKGDDSLSRKLLKLKTLDNPTPEESKLKDNVLIKELYPLLANKDHDTDNIRIYSKRFDTFTSNQLTAAFREIQDLDASLAKDLMDFAILQSGLNNSAITFMGVVPFEYYGDIVKSAFDEFDKKNGAEELYKFNQLFIRNNSKNPVFFRKAKKMELSKISLGNGMYGKLYSSNLYDENAQTIDLTKKDKVSLNRYKDIIDLFDSNPELANAVYEALGFKEQQYVSKLKEIAGRRKLATKSDLENSQLIKDLRVDKSQPKALKPNAADNNLAAIMLYGMRMSELKDKGLSEERMEATTLAYRILNDFIFDMDELSFYEDILLENPEYASVLSTNENPVKEFFENDIFEQADKEKFEITPEQKQEAQKLYSQYLDTKQPDVILPIGTSGSGKSTFIKSLPQENLVVIEPDAMRVEFTGNMNDKSKDKEIYIEAAKRAIKAIKQGKQVVFDTTNLTKDKRLPFIEAIKKEIPNANIQYKLMELNPELAKQRIKAQLERGENRAAVSDETIDRHAASYKQMLEDIKNEPITEYKDLGSKQDIEGFKDFVENNKSETPIEFDESTEIEDYSPEILDNSENNKKDYSEDLDKSEESGNFVNWKKEPDMVPADSLSEFKKAVGLRKSQVDFDNRYSILRKTKAFNKEFGSNYSVSFKKVGESNLFTYEITGGPRIVKDVQAEIDFNAPVELTLTSAEYNKIVNDIETSNLSQEEKQSLLKELSEARNDEEIGSVIKKFCK